MFQNPQNGNYDFAPNSPALEMGIKPIILDQFGVQNEKKFKYSSKPNIY